MTQDWQPPLDSDNPFDLFGTWLAAAEESEPNDPNAMSLATVNEDGLPAVRIVLLKGFDTDGFVFYTNTLSRKGQELWGNPVAALCFHWKSLRRQVRIEGAVLPVTEEEADAYYQQRPRGSRIGAWASKQSQNLPERAELERRVAAFEQEYPGDNIPRPAHWSGYRLVPNYLEFWVDRPFRLHDRKVFDNPTDGTWQISRIYP